MPLRLAADRVIFSQDGNQNAQNRWTYYEYDNLNRLTEQGECTKSGSTATGKTVRIKNYYDNYNFRARQVLTTATSLPTIQDTEKDT